MKSMKELFDSYYQNVGLCQDDYESVVEDLILALDKVNPRLHILLIMSCTMQEMIEDYAFNEESLPDEFYTLYQQICDNIQIEQNK